MLTLTEEVLLLLGDEEGTFLPVDKHAFDCALAGAVLLDLAFAYRIDTDPQVLTVIDPAPTGMPMLDRILAKLASRADAVDAASWIGELSTDDAETVREQALASLVEREILERKEEPFLWVFRPVRYPMIDGEAVQEIKLRIDDVLSDPRDVALLSLVDACQILPDLFPDRKLNEVTPRIGLLRKMDLIGREVAGMIANIQRTIILAARAEAARFKKLRLILAAVGDAAAAVTLFAPRVPVPDSYGPNLLEHLWFDGIWRQWSGYLILGLAILGLAIAIVIKKRLVTQIARSHRWRLSHFVLGAGCVLVLFAHTGFRLGSDLNAALIGFFLAVLLTGALAEICTGTPSRLRAIGIAKARQAAPASDAAPHHGHMSSAGATDRPYPHGLPVLTGSAGVSESYFLACVGDAAGFRLRRGVDVRERGPADTARRRDDRCPPSAGDVL